MSRDAITILLAEDDDGHARPRLVGAAAETTARARPQPRALPRSDTGARADPRAATGSRPLRRAGRHGRAIDRR